MNESSLPTFKKRKLDIHRSQRDEGNMPKANGNHAMAMDLILEELARLQRRVTRLESPGLFPQTQTTSTPNKQPQTPVRAKQHPVVVEISDDEPVLVEGGTRRSNAASLNHLTPRSAGDDKTRPAIHQTFTGRQQDKSPSIRGFRRVASYPNEESRQGNPVTQGGAEFLEQLQIPAVVRRLPPIHVALPERSNSEFSSQFLRKVFRGQPLANGWHTVAGRSQAFPDVCAYVMLNREFEPLLPRVPGQHGAQITPYMQYNELEDFPLFIHNTGDKGFMYYGTYKAALPSDYLGHNEMLQVSHAVKKHWANRLGSRGVDGKSLPNVLALKELWPRVPIGWWDPTRREMLDFDENIDIENGEIEVLRRAITDEEAVNLTEDDIMAAFERHDLEDDPVCGVRMFYEYLECVGYDADFYRKLVATRDGKQFT